MLEERAALEALKPASGFIAAILGPKIEKVKKWANEKELKGKLDSGVLARVMEGYLIDLSERVSEITSITFPQEKLNIFRAYEPLYMKLSYRAGRDSKSISIEDIINPSRSSMMIVDGAGMGKSTFSKYIVARLLHKSDKIPILFDLRKVDSDLDIVGNIATELDSPGSKFDRDLFYKLIELGKFFVILDGFDEVKVDHQSELANQIYSLSAKGGRNTLLVTSRPQEKLPELVRSNILRFIPFTLEQAISLLGRYDEISGLDIGARLTKEMKNVPEKFIESPLLVSLLYRTFGVNNTIADRVTTFYDEIYHALYKGHDLMNKNGYVRDKKSNLDFEDFRKLLRALCHLMMINRKTAFKSWSEATSFIEKAAAVASVSPESTSAFFDDLFVAVPLMQKDGTEYKFFHKTLLEYFAAEYIIFNKSSMALLRKIFEGSLAPSFSKVFEFLEDIDQSLFESVITQGFARKARKMPLSGDHQDLAISTCVYMNSFKLGLWPVHGNTEDLEGHDRPVLSGEIHTQSGNDSTCWSHGLLNGIPHFLCISYSAIHENMHSIAWQSITREVFDLDYEENEHGGCSLDGIEEIIPIGEWVTPSKETIKKLRARKCVITKDVFLTAISDEVINEGRNPRVLDRKKIDALLNKIKSRDALDVEMDEYL